MLKMLCFQTCIPFLDTATLLLLLLLLLFLLLLLLWPPIVIAWSFWLSCFAMCLGDIVAVGLSWQYISKDVQCVVSGQLLGHCDNWLQGAVALPGSSHCKLQQQTDTKEVGLLGDTKTRLWLYSKVRPGTAKTVSWKSRGLFCYWGYQISICFSVVPSQQWLPHLEKSLKVAGVGGRQPPGTCMLSGRKAKCGQE